MAACALRVSRRLLQKINQNRLIILQKEQLLLLSKFDATERCLNKSFFSEANSDFTEDETGTKSTTSVLVKNNDIIQYTGPLVEYILNLEKQFDQPEGAEDIPMVFTKASKKGSVSSALQTYRPQILGFTVEEIQTRLKVLEGVGITGKHALLISVELPSHLNLNTPNFQEIAEFLQSLGCNMLKIITKAPYIFGVNCNSLMDNVKKLREIGISNEVIGKAVEYNPILVVYSISDDALKVMQALLSCCEFDENVDGQVSEYRYMDKHEFALRLLMQPLDGLREQAVLGSNFQKVALFLQELQISPCLMALNYPAFFSTDVANLYEALEFFTSRPLFFETELIQKLMVTRSDVFMNFDRRTFEKRVELLKSVLKTPRQLYMLLQKYFFFKRGDMHLEENIKILQNYGFQNEHLAKILTTKDFFVTQESNLDDKIKFLLALENVDVDLIAEFSFCLLKPLQFLESRIQFLKDTKPSRLKQINIQEVFGTDDEEFATQISESTLEKYRRVAGPLVLINVKPRIRKPRKIKQQE